MLVEVLGSCFVQFLVSDMTSVTDNVCVQPSHSTHNMWGASAIPAYLHTRYFWVALLLFIGRILAQASLYFRFGGLWYATFGNQTLNIQLKAQNFQGGKGCAPSNLLAVPPTIQCVPLPLYKLFIINTYMQYHIHFMNLQMQIFDRKYQ